MPASHPANALPIDAAGVAAPFLAAQPASFNQRVLRAGGWSIVGFGVTQACRLGGNLVMTRLLAPEMFGVMAISTMVSIMLGLFSDIGLHQNIVQSRRGDEAAFLDTAWVVQIVRGVGLWLIALLISLALYAGNLHGLFPLQSVYAAPELVPVIAIGSFSAVLSGFASTKMATAHRTLEQKRLVVIEAGSQLASLAVMVIVGVVTHLIWALVAGGLVSALTSTVLSHAWLKGRANRFRLEKSALGELFGFGRWIIVSSAAGVLAMSGDRLLLGGFVNAHVLGLYAIAMLMIASIELMMARLFVNVSLPALSEVARNDLPRLRELYYRMRVPADLLLLFVAGLLFMAGHFVIELLYDARYAAAGGMLQILALSLFVVRYGIAHQIYLALGKPRYLAVISVVRLIALYTLVPALYYLGGLHAAIWAIALHGLATLPFVYYFNSTLGLNDLRRELLVLVALPAGLLCGASLNLLVA